jgi:hypothetical protein
MDAPALFVVMFYHHPGPCRETVLKVRTTPSHPSNCRGQNNPSILRPCPRPESKASVEPTCALIAHVGLEGRNEQGEHHAALCAEPEVPCLRNGPRIKGGRSIRPQQWAMARFAAAVPSYSHNEATGQNPRIVLFHLFKMAASSTFSLQIQKLTFIAFTQELLLSSGQSSGQLDQGAARGGEGGVPLWGVVPASRLHRDEPYRFKPRGSALLQQARHGGVGSVGWSGAGARVLPGCDICLMESLLNLASLPTHRIHPLTIGRKSCLVPRTSYRQSVVGNSPGHTSIVGAHGTGG